LAVDPADHQTLEVVVVRSLFRALPDRQPVVLNFALAAVSWAQLEDPLI